MLRSRAPSAIAGAVLVMVSVLTACAQSPVPPVNDIERGEIRQKLLDSSWQTVSSRFGAAVRPVVSIERTVDDPDAEVLVADCLERAGFTPIGDAFAITDDPNRSDTRTPLGFELARYSCTATYPRLSRVVASLSDDQVGSLWDYYTATVRPCLIGLGLPTSDPPERGFFVSRYGLDTWNPFDVLRRNDPAGVLDVAKEQCPPVPTWLDLAAS